MQRLGPLFRGEDRARGLLAVRVACSPTAGRTSRILRTGSLFDRRCLRWQRGSESLEGDAACVKTWGGGVGGQRGSKSWALRAVSWPWRLWDGSVGRFCKSESERNPCSPLSQR